ncbi:MAG: copper resistance protein CopC [Chloroflexota bacterium]
MTAIASSPRLRVVAPVVGALAALMLLAGVAAAHSELVSSVPKDKATISSEPVAPIVLNFSEELASGSHADITGPGGSKTGSATVDPTNNKRLTFTPDAPLPAGGYTIAWTSVATDSDVLRGKITFTVQAAASAPPSTPPSASASAAPSVAAPSSSPSPSPDDASATATSAILPVLAAILIIAVLGLVLLRNRRPSARG